VPLLAGNVLTDTGVPVVLTAPGVPAVLPAGAQAARARDKITKKVPIRVTRFNFCCFIIKPPFNPPNQGGVNLTFGFIQQRQVCFAITPVNEHHRCIAGSPLL
jgi:hypothetical protein